MIKLKLHRDKARELQQHFFPYITEQCLLKICEADNITYNTKERLQARINYFLFGDVKDKFNHLLKGTFLFLQIKMTHAEACAFYYWLINFPYNDNWKYMVWWIYIKRSLLF